MIFDSKTRVLKFLLLAAIAITFINFIVDFYNTLNYPGTDFRNRVVGARLALAGIDPYFFKWHPGLPETFYDPMANPEEILSKLSVPPTVLTLHSPIASLTYLQQKIAWLVTQWAVLIGIILIFIKTAKSESQRNLILVLGFFFANGLFWRFHINSGQIYIVYIGLLSVSWLLLNQKFKYNQVASGFFAGITASLRPPYILLFPFFITRRQYSFVAGGIAGILFSILSSIAVTGTSIWKQYALTMMGMTGFINLQKIMPKLSQTLAAGTANYSSVVEGFDFQFRNPLEERFFTEVSLRGVLIALDISNKKEILVIGFILTLAVFCWVSIKYGFKQVDSKLIFLWSIVLCLVGELFIPIARFPYYDVQWLLPLLIIVSLTDYKELFNSKIVWFLLVGLALNIGCFSWIEKSLFFSTYSIAIYVFLTAILLLKQKGLKQEKLGFSVTVSD